MPPSTLITSIPDRPNAVDNASDATFAWPPPSADSATTGGGVSASRRM